MRVNAVAKELHFIGDWMTTFQSGEREARPQTINTHIAQLRNRTAMGFVNRTTIMDVSAVKSDDSDVS